MLYCPPNVSLSDIWVNHGTSQCFMDTAASGALLAYTAVFGTIQYCFYRNFATRMMRGMAPKSRLYGLQVLLSVLLMLLAVVRFALFAFFFGDKTIYGYMILSLACSLFIYPFSLLLLHMERNYMLHSVPTRGHGIILLLFWTMILIQENLPFFNLSQPDWWFRLKTVSDQANMALFVLRYVFCLVVFILGINAPGLMQTSDYYNLNDAINDIMGDQDENRSTFRNAWRKIRVLAPFLWPRKDFLLQLRVLVCIFLLIAGRVVNLFVPLYSGLIVDSMTGSLPLTFRWDWVLIYVGLKFLQGGGTAGMGFLNNARSFLWIRVQQYTTREVVLELFRHLHSLSLRWHLGRKTGEVLRVMDRGTDSINNLLNYIIFSILPTIVDIVVAVVFFVSSFNKWFGLIIFTTMFLYLISTIVVTEWRTKFQRRMNLAENETRARSVDSLLNFETVKYYGAEAYEVASYRDCIVAYQIEEFKTSLTLNILNITQNVIISSGLLAGSLLCVRLVVRGEGLTVGDYALFTAYIMQLYVPLNWFGTYYRMIQKNFVDMENMFDLLREQQEVVDAPGAGPLRVAAGAVSFNNVTFGYQPERIVLKNVSFTVPPGKTVALVGPSGSGKSTIIRLLFRFYDVEAGSISLDEQNIKTVTQESLRSCIGVVPQDTVLFNNSLRYNIRYGRILASDQQVMEAAKNADIHDRILTFPDGYDTQVGERGLRLSGGEKQRVAIARTLLKDPQVVLLDEATSALDTETERYIQKAIQRVCADRTTIIVAHRLSTVIHADEILVLKEGEIVERGRHDDLVGFGGVYAGMWQQQLQNEEAAHQQG